MNPDVLNSVVIYLNDDGGVSVLSPAPNVGLTLEEIAQKDVPKGVPYKIMQRADLPATKEDRDDWFVDVADLTDGVGGPVEAGA